MSRCTLWLGDDPVLVAHGGAPRVEYALFEAGDIELGATEPGAIREVGYSTSAGQALERLTELGITSALAEEAAAATKKSLVHAYARGAAVRVVAEHFGAGELFEGGTLDGAAGTYAGSWLDLSALANDLDVDSGSDILQAMHLAALLEDHGPETVVRLVTGELSADRRPGARSFRRIAWPSDPSQLPQALHSLVPPSDRGRSADGPAAAQIVERLRLRARGCERFRARLERIERAATDREAPDSGPLADAELWALDRSVSRGESADAPARLDAMEQRRGRLPGIAYLRAKVALMTGAEPARAIAERISELSNSMPSFHELELLAAQAWGVAGDSRRSWAFARDLVENNGASDWIRMHALDVLAGTSPCVPQAPRSGPESSSSVPPPPGPAPQSFRMEPLREGAWSIPPPRDGAIEFLENLSVPAPLQVIPNSFDPERPRNHQEARLACILWAKELGRDLRQRHGVDVKCDLGGLETTQRYLREFVEGVRDAARVKRELLLHGSFVGELFAREIGARWAEFEAEAPRQWAMMVATAAQREHRENRDATTRPHGVLVWPFARVERFAAMGYRERDLVSYYLEVRAACRSSS